MDLALKSDAEMPQQHEVSVLDGRTISHGHYNANLEMKVRAVRKKAPTAKGSEPSRHSTVRRRAIGQAVFGFIVVFVVVIAVVGVISLVSSPGTSEHSKNSNTSSPATGRSTSTVSYTATAATFLYRTLPEEFGVNGYTFHMEYNGTGGYGLRNGTATANLGFSLVLRVSDGTANQTVVFGWAPPAPAPQSLPVPDQSILFDGRVQMRWYSNSTGTYLQVLAGAPNSQTSESGRTTLSNGLRLLLGLSPSVLPQGDGVSISVSLINALPTRNNLTVSGGGTRLNLGPCSQLPLGVGVFRGNYDAANLSAGTPLGLYYPGMYSCPAMFGVAYWSFAPLSDNVTLVSDQPTGLGNATAPQDVWTQKAGADLEYWGYWSGRAEFYPSVNASFTAFQPGSYTVAAEDAWGEETIMHFTVVAATKVLTCATISSNSSFVPHGNESTGPGPLKLDAYYQLGTSNSYVLALSATGSSPVILTFFNYAGNSQLQFSPNPSTIASWQFYAPDGTLAYPATFYPGQCTLIRIVLPNAPPQIPLSLEFSDNESQEFMLSP